MSFSYRVIGMAETVLEAKHKTSPAGVQRPTVTLGVPSHLTHMLSSIQTAAEHEVNHIPDQCQVRERK